MDEVLHLLHDFRCPQWLFAGTRILAELPATAGAHAPALGTCPVFSHGSQLGTAEGEPVITEPHQ